MTDEVTREIKDILEQGQPKRSGWGGCININGDNNTVIIGNHPGRPQEDQNDDDDSAGLSKPHRSMRAELDHLRIQFRRIARLLTRLLLKPGLKDIKGRYDCSAPCLRSYDAAAPESPYVSNHTLRARCSQHLLETRAIPSFIPFYFSKSHIVSVVSDLMAAHSRHVARLINFRANSKLAVANQYSLKKYPEYTI
ncbi:hypothetical protein EZI54_03820 [Marinobacter halodurans]|uniref:Uncharacterized protein n=1 Tax=Marinobacter halodurans TaxID=2528979 RepID=A0ABY1ZPK4_9GAMM|nr:hypothetical protein [Marinobacter halodurans]TBW58521.1 hypothetical protein EZI54_03820 [Marinobacter halodurans]